MALILVLATAVALQAGGASAAPPRTPDLSKVESFLSSDEKVNLALERHFPENKPDSLMLGPDLYPTYSIRPPAKERLAVATADTLLAFDELVVPVRTGSRVVGFITLAWGEAGWRYSGLSPDTELVSILQRGARGAAPFYDPLLGVWLSLKDSTVAPIDEKVTTKLGRSWSLADYANIVLAYPQTGPTGDALGGGPVLGVNDPPAESHRYPWIPTLLISAGLSVVAGMTVWIRSRRQES
jgi:hypothetical protein